MKYLIAKKNDLLFQEKEKLIFIGTQEKFSEINTFKNKEIDLFIIDEAYKLVSNVNSGRSYIAISKWKFYWFWKNEIKILETTFNGVDKDFYRSKDEDDFYYKLNKKVSKKEKTILFLKTPQIISKKIEKIEKVPDLISKEIILQIENDIHPEWSLVKFLKKGILVHHGQMPKYLQNKVIELFLKQKKYFLLIGTNSISEEINTPHKKSFHWKIWRRK